MKSHFVVTDMQCSRSQLERYWNWDSAEEIEVDWSKRLKMAFGAVIPQIIHRDERKRMYITGKMKNNKLGHQPENEIELTIKPVVLVAFRLVI